ncbi:MAG: SDR family NAD(P)-dependent oxidoreductase [Pseudomonadota bacterium]
MTGPQPALTDAERAGLSDRVVVVTGATRGIGWATAVLLAECGAQVVAVGRKIPKLEELDDAIRAAGGPAPTLVPIDLTDGPGIDRLGAAIADRWGHLDAFVGNAGVLGPVSPLGHVKAKAWAEAMDVNVSANWRLLRTLDPVLRKAAAGRVVFITSGLAAKPKPFFGPYAVTKMALEGLAKVYALETETTAIDVRLFNPGPVRTGLRAQAMPGENPSGLPSPADVAPGIARLCLP